MSNLKEGKISNHGLLYVLIILMLAKLFLGFPRAMVGEGANAAWLLILLSGVIAAVGIFFIVKLLQKFPGQNFIEIAETLWGRPGAITVAVILFLLFFYTAAVAVREFSESMLITVLPQTPISVIAFFFLAAMILGAYNGLEVITRATVLLFPFIIGGIFSILLLTMNYINLNNFFPLLGTGLDQLLYHAPGRSSAFVDIILVGLLASNVTEPAKIPKQVWKAFLITMLIFITVEIFYTCVIRVQTAGKLYVPLFQMARMIYMGRFIQRIEVIYIFVWFFVGGLKLTISLYGAATSLSRGFKIPIYQPLVFPIGLLIFAVSFIPAGVITAVHMDMGVLREYGAVLWALPAALLVTAAVRGKGGGQAGQP